MYKEIVDTPALLKAEIEEYNKHISFSIQGSPRWLAKREKLENFSQLPPANRYASIVFAVLSFEEKQRLLRERVISVAGVAVYLADFYESTPGTQCSNCYKFGHSSAGCRTKGCKFCLQAHYLKDHAGCKDCKTTGKLCSHQKPICRNCKGDHLATSSTCSLWAARATSPSLSLNTSSAQATVSTSRTAVTVVTTPLTPTL